MLKSRTRRVLTLFALCTVLFAQAVAAAEACLKGASTLPGGVAVSGPSHCDSAQKVSLNLCFYQCADQADSSATPQPPLAASAPTLRVSPAIAVSPATRTSVRLSAANHDPPIPIRFCSFLI